MKLNELFGWATRPDAPRPASYVLVVDGKDVRRFGNLGDAVLAASKYPQNHVEVFDEDNEVAFERKPKSPM